MLSAVSRSSFILLISLTEERRYHQCMDSGDRLSILWQGGVTSCIYADDRDGGRVIIDIPEEGPTLMKCSEFGRHKLTGGMGAVWGTPLDQEYERLLAAGLVDDTTV